MYFDYLSDDINNPKLSCVKCDIEDKILSSSLLFVKSYIYTQDPIILKDKYDTPICVIEIPLRFIGLNYAKVLKETETFKLKLKVINYLYGYA